MFNEKGLIALIGFCKAGKGYAACCILGNGGYYDIFLSRLSTDTVLVGVGYDFQLAEVVPVSRKDKPVNYVITPTEGILKAKRD